MDRSNTGGGEYMGPNPLNNGGIFLEETRRKFNQLSIEVDQFFKYFIITIIASNIALILGIIFIHWSIAIFEVLLNSGWCIFLGALKPMKGINQKQFEEAFYGDQYSANEVNVEEVLTWLENVKEAYGKLNALKYASVMYYVLPTIGILITTIVIKVLLGG